MRVVPPARCSASMTRQPIGVEEAGVVAPSALRARGVANTSSHSTAKCSSWLSCTSGSSGARAATLQHVEQERSAVCHHHARHEAVAPCAVVVGSAARHAHEQGEGGGNHGIRQLVGAPAPSMPRGSGHTPQPVVHHRTSLLPCPHLCLVIRREEEGGGRRGEGRREEEEGE